MNAGVKYGIIGLSCSGRFKTRLLTFFFFLLFQTYCTNPCEYVLKSLLKYLLGVELSKDNVNL